MDSEKHIIAMVLIWIIGFVLATVIPCAINVNIDHNAPVIELVAIAIATAVTWVYLLSAIKPLVNKSYDSREEAL